MNQIKVFSLFLTCFCFFACYKTPIKHPDAIIVNCERKTNQVDSVRQLITGTYKWVYTEVRDRGFPSDSLQTPSSIGIHRTYVFDENGKVRYFENGHLQSTCNYQIDYEMKISTYTLDSMATVIATDPLTGKKIYNFRAYLCNDSALFYNPYGRSDFFQHFTRE